METVKLRFGGQTGPALCLKQEEVTTHVVAAEVDRIAGRGQGIRQGTQVSHQAYGSELRLQDVRHTRDMIRAVDVEVEVQRVANHRVRGAKAAGCQDRSGQGQSSHRGLPESRGRSPARQALIITPALHRVIRRRPGPGVRVRNQQRSQPLARSVHPTDNPRARRAPMLLRPTVFALVLVIGTAADATAQSDEYPFRRFRVRPTPQLRFSFDHSFRFQDRADRYRSSRSSVLKRWRIGHGTGISRTGTGNSPSEIVPSTGSIAPSSGSSSGSSVTSTGIRSDSNVSNSSVRSGSSGTRDYLERQGTVGRHSVRPSSPRLSGVGSAIPALGCRRSLRSRSQSHDLM